MQLRVSPTARWYGSARSGNLTLEELRETVRRVLAKGHARLALFPMERRLILQLVSAGFLVPASNAQPEDYKPLFFTPEQMDALDRLTEILIPADDHSPGASDALVNRYLDVIVAGSSETAQRIWRQGMEAVEAEAKSRFQHGLAACSPEQREQIVATMAANELNPSTELERFFRTLKRMTIDGYYTSKIGIHEELEYQGNTVVANFEGCTHPEHQA